MTLDLKKTDFGRLRELVGRIPWEAGLQEKEAQESGVCFKIAVLRV